MLRRSGCAKSEREKFPGGMPAIGGQGVM